jgi:hypothetical protein
MHPPEVTDTAAAFAGLSEPPDGLVMERLAGAVDHWWPAVHRLVVADLETDRSPEWPLLVTSSDSGLAMADSFGVFPILMRAKGENVAEMWRAFQRPPLLAEPGLPAWDPDIPLADDEAATAPLTEWANAGAERPAAGRLDLAGELDGPLDVVAGVGLAAISWQLWHEHEPTHPMLALWRLGDLDGQAHFDPDLVTVRIPLGRRHADLRDHGLLRPVDDVPWLGGRRLEFVGG